MFKVNVPFYSNTADNTHCFQAVIRSVLKYFLPNKEFSFKELDKLSAKKKGLWTWSMAALLNLKKMGFEIINMEDWDYEAFANDAESYLKEKVGEKVAKIQIKNSDVAAEVKNATMFLKAFGNQKTLPSVSDIKRLSKDGYIVCCNVNAYALENKKGYSGHFVLIVGFDENNLWIHDPGLPATANLKISNKQFIKAWAYPNDSVKNLMAFKYPK